MLRCNISILFTFALLMLLPLNLLTKSTPTFCILKRNFHFIFFKFDDQFFSFVLLVVHILNHCIGLLESLQVNEGPRCSVLRVEPDRHFIKKLIILKKTQNFIFKVNFISVVLGIEGRQVPNINSNSLRFSVVSSKTLLDLYLKRTSDWTHLPISHLFKLRSLLPTCKSCIAVRTLLLLRTPNCQFHCSVLLQKLTYLAITSVLLQVPNPHLYFLLVVRILF